MNKEQIIDEVYKNYLNEWTFEKYPNDGSVYSVEPIKVKEHSKEQFVYRCKTDTEFSEKWGLKIEERELSLEERRKLANYDSEFVSPMTVESWDRNNIPTKLITLEYNQEKIYIYE
jgi:hypothetical protein